MLEKGLSAQSRTTVTNENTAAAMGSGDLPVFATIEGVAKTSRSPDPIVAAVFPAVTVVRLWADNPFSSIISNSFYTFIR